MNDPNSVKKPNARQRRRRRRKNASKQQQTQRPTQSSLHDKANDDQKQMIEPQKRPTKPKATFKPPIPVKPPTSSLPPWIEFTGKDKKKPILKGWGHRVREVLSGDTLRIALLKLPKQDKLLPSKTIQVTLDGIQVPLCQRYKDQNISDEPYGYNAREFVRNFVMNKAIFYAIWRVVTYNNQNQPKYYGDIYVQINKNQRKSLTAAIIYAGYGYVIYKGSHLSKKERQTLNKLQNHPKKNKLNIWSYNRNSAYTLSDSTRKYVRRIVWVKRYFHFSEQYKGKLLKGIVDQVINGSTVRCELILNDNKYKHVSIILNIGGIIIPNDYNYDLSIFALKAKEWTSERLLGQYVTVKILIGTQRNVYAQIIHPNGRIAPSLLKKGLVEYELFSSQFCDNEEKKYLLQSLDYAKNNKINIWSVKPTNSSPISLKNKQTKFVNVYEVLSGDTIVILDNNNKIIYKLAYIKAPRFASRKRLKKDDDLDDKKQNKKRNQKRNENKKRVLLDSDEYLAREAKDFLRKKCIGKKVRLFYRNYMFASVYLQLNKDKEENLSLSLISKGYAELLDLNQNMYKTNDYKLLEKAHKNAVSKKIGIFVEDDRNVTLIKDYTFVKKEDKYERIHLNDYLRSRKVKAIVEYIYNPNRIKLYIPQKKAIITVTLPDIKYAGWFINKNLNNKMNNWIGDACEYLNSTILQREVYLQVISSIKLDKQELRTVRFSRIKQSHTAVHYYTSPDNPNFIGHIFYNNQNIAEYLIQQGWVTVITNKLQAGGGGGPPESWLELQANAMKLNIGIHEIQKSLSKYNLYDNTGKLINVKVICIKSATVFYVNLLSDDNYSKQKLIQDTLQNNDNSLKKPHKIIRGFYYAALYQHSYGRVKVIHRDNTNDNKLWFVLFIDYGNTSQVKESDIRLLPSTIKIDVIPLLAIKCELAGLRAPNKNINSSSSNNNLWYRAGKWLTSQIFNKKCKIKVLYHDIYEDLMYVEVFLGKISINHQILRLQYVEKQNDKVINYKLKNPDNRVKQYVNKYFIDLKINVEEKKEEKEKTEDIKQFGSLLSISHYERIYFSFADLITLVNGYIKYIIYNRKQKSFRYYDVIHLIALYSEDNVFIYKWSSPPNVSHMYDGLALNLISVPKKWPFTLTLTQRVKSDQFCGVELNINATRNKSPSFVKLYYEMECENIYKIRFWKGVLKFSRYAIKTPILRKKRLLFPSKYLKKLDIIQKNSSNKNKKNKKNTIKLSIKFLCVQYHSYLTGSKHFFRDLSMKINNKFNWLISNNYNTLKYFKNKPESTLFSKNYDNNTWCLYAKYIKKAQGRKHKKFYFGVMLLNLPWFINYVEMQILIKCNKEKKEKIAKIWPGFENAAHIQFKSSLLHKSNSLNVTIKQKILRVYDTNDTLINFTQWKKYHIL